MAMDSDPGHAPAPPAPGRTHTASIHDDPPRAHGWRCSHAFVTAIEGDDYSACGGDSYARGYIRSIAGAVGADPEPLIREYNTAQPRPQPTMDGLADPATVTRMGEWTWRAWLAVVVLFMGGLW